MVQSWPVAVVLVAVVAAVSSSPLSGGSSSSTAAAAARPDTYSSSDSSAGEQHYPQQPLHRRAADWTGQRNADLRDLLLPSYTQSGPEGTVVGGVEGPGALSEQDAPDYLSRYEDRSALPYREGDYVDALNAVAASLSRDQDVGPSGLVAPADGGDLTKRSSLLSMAGSRNIGEAGGLSNDLSSSRNSGLTSSLGGGGGGFSSSGGLSSLSGGLGSGRSSGGLSSLSGGLGSSRSGGLSSLSGGVGSSRSSGGLSSLSGGVGSSRSSGGLSSLSGGVGSGRSSGGLSSLSGGLGSGGRSMGGLSSGRNSGLSSIGGGGLGNSPSRSLIGSTAGNWPRGRSLSLSIDASMKVLRQALLFKSARLRQQEQMSRARQNHEYLQTIGKRSAPSLQEDSDDERQ